MADSSTDTRARAGSASDRRVTLTASTALGGGVALVVGFSDWLILECFKTGAWHYVPPSKTLVEMAATIAVFPVFHFIGRVVVLIGRKVLSALGDNGDE